MVTLYTGTHKNVVERERERVAGFERKDERRGDEPFHEG
jgi:hypothetical protein